MLVVVPFVENLVCEVWRSDLGLDKEEPWAQFCKGAHVDMEPTLTMKWIQVVFSISLVCIVVT